MARRMLPRLLSRWNVASRKDAEAMVAGGRVTVDGRVVRDVLREVDEACKTVCVDGQPAGPNVAFAWWMLNKPRGVVTTTRDPEGRATALSLIASPEAGLAPVGRLDQDTGGLLLLTNEHALAADLLAPERHVVKRYRAKVEGHPGEDALRALRETSLVEEGLVLGPMGVEVERVAERSTWLQITLAEGKNRQIRRRMAHVGHPVLWLVRTRFGPLDLGDLAPGASRRLTGAEIAALRGASKGA